MGGPRVRASAIGSAETKAAGRPRALWDLGMTLHVPRLRGGGPTAERAFALHVGLTTATALAILGALAPNIDWRIDAPALFWLLSALVLVGELLPIPVPRRQGLAKVTISTAFAFAILLRFGVWPALLVYVGAC
jgi:hypothetical protein